MNTVESNIDKTDKSESTKPRNVAGVPVQKKR